MTETVQGAQPRRGTAGRTRVVLYNPKAVFFTMPLALLAIGSELDPEQFEVVIVDGRLEPDPERAVLAQLDGALCLGVTVLTGAPISDALQISRAVKSVRPELPIVWGGWHPSMFASECLAEPSVDITVRGQGEETFADIVQRLARCIEPGGYLFVGHSETLHSIDHSLNYVCPAVYRRGSATGRKSG